MCVCVRACADSDSDPDPDSDSDSLIVHRMMLVFHSDVEPFAVSSSDSAQTMAASSRASGAVPQHDETQMVSLEKCQDEDSESEEVVFLAPQSSEELLRSFSRPIEPIRVGDSVQVNVKDGDFWHWIPGHIIHVGSTSDVKVGYKIAGEHRTKTMFVGSRFLRYVPAETR